AFARDLEKKRLAGVDLAADIVDGRSLVAAAREATRGHRREALDAFLSGLEALSGNERALLLTAKETVAAMAATDTRPFLSRSTVAHVEAERKRAIFGSWYELFPRSQTDDPKRHG